MSIKQYLSYSTLLFILIFTLRINPAVANLGVLKEVLSTGYSDGWAANIESGEYWLENINQQGAIRYYYAAHDGINHQRKISTKVIVDAADPYSQAGLLYGFDNATRSYFLVVISAEGLFSVTRRDSNGFQALFETYLELNPKTFTVITIQENRNQLLFFINGNNVGEITHPAAGKGHVGIVAIGTGKFGFTDFADTEKTPSYSRHDNRPSVQADASNSSTSQITSASSTSRHPIDEPFKTHSIRDEFGFEKPMEAMKISVPKSWEVKGAVQWYGKPSCALDVSLPKVHLKTTARNGTQWLEIIPGGIWAWDSNFDAMPAMRKTEIAGCDVRRILDIQTFVNQYIPKIRPNATLNSTNPRPDVIQEMMQENGALWADFQRQNPNMRLRPEAMEIKLSYNANGRTVNELMITIILFLDQPGVDVFGGMRAIQTMAMAMGTTMTATVEGPADERLMKAIGDTIVHNQQYQARLQQFVNQRTRQMAKATQRKFAANRSFRAKMAKSSSTAKTYSDILDSNMNSWNKIQGMKDAGQSKIIDATLEQTPWQSTYGETVYMPQQYQRVIQLPNDVFAGTNDNFFNPINGSQLNQ